MSTIGAPVIYIVEPYGGSIRRQNANLPMIYFDDAAVTRGDGVFESLLIHGGKPVNLDRHLRRFRSSAKQMDLPQVDPDHWTKALQVALDDWRSENTGADGAVTDALCSWTLTRGRASTGNASAWITVRPVPSEYERMRAEGVRVMTSPRGYSIDRSEGNEVPWLALGAKTLNYAATMAALRYAGTQGYDDVIFTDATSRVLEGATSTVIAVRKGRKLRTPASHGDVLPGTSQRAIFAYAEKKGWRCKEKDIDVRYLTRSESVWLVSSVRQAVRVTSIDGVDLPTPADEEEIRELLTTGILSA